MGCDIYTSHRKAVFYVYIGSSEKIFCTFFSTGRLILGIPSLFVSLFYLIIICNSSTNSSFRAIFYKLFGFAVVMVHSLQRSYLERIFQSSLNFLVIVPILFISNGPFCSWVEDLVLDRQTTVIAIGSFGGYEAFETY